MSAENENKSTHENSRNSGGGQRAPSPGKAILHGFLMGLGMAGAHKVVDGADQAIRGTNTTPPHDMIDDSFDGF